MATNGITTHASTTTIAPRRRKVIISGLVIRVLIAFIISWLIVMAFFVSGVVSR